MYKSKSQAISRSQMLQWINRTLNINQTRIENLGSGVIYCMLINNYHPNTIIHNKIIQNPRSPIDNRANLRRLQEGLASLQIKNIAFDAFKVAEMTFSENWSLICKIYKYFTEHGREKNISNDTNQWLVQNVESKVDVSFSKNCTIPTALSTPMKGNKMNDDGGKMRWHTMNLIEQIKKIVSTEGSTDRVKVGQLRRLLGLQDEQGLESQTDLKDLLSDYKKNQQVIQID